ncbi:protein-L-isoaspartate O-methyltransferase family protein [Acrocarpospora pleiomorpha]
MEQADKFIDPYVDALVVAGAIRSQEVERAFRAVPRHHFISQIYLPPAGPNDRGFRKAPWNPSAPDVAHLSLIYSDSPLVTRLADGMPMSSSSSPSLMAEMLELLLIKPGSNILEIGTATGFNAALIAGIAGPAGRVVSVEIDPPTAEQARMALTAYSNVSVLTGDGGERERLPKGEAFDKVIVTVGAADLSPAWVACLAPGGTILVPLERGGSHALVTVGEESGQIRGKIVGWTGFVSGAGTLSTGHPLRGLAMVPPSEMHEKSLRAGLGQGAWMRTMGVHADEVDFYCYLSLIDERALWTPFGSGLVEGRAWAAAGQGMLRWTGGKHLAKDLERAFGDWERLGRPSTADWLLEFHPTSTLPRKETRWWVRRRFYDWVFRLAADCT